MVLKKHVLWGKTLLRHYIKKKILATKLRDTPNVGFRGCGHVAPSEV